MQKDKKPLILVTNDDGVTAPGITFLISIAKKIGDVIVVAPNKPQSGMGHAITIHEPLRVNKVDFHPGTTCYESTGTPVDCVKLANDMILKGQKKPDLLISGVNHGSNSSINVIYSGTMSAAVEGAIQQIPSIGFSLCDYALDADFEPSRPFIEQIIKATLKHKMPSETLLNVNIPKTPNIKGIKVCRQANAKWEESLEKREDPTGKPYYWMVGNFTNLDKGTDTDEWALSNDYISVVPVHYDLTAYHAIAGLHKWNFNHEK